MELHPGSNLILVANDDVSTNTMRQNLMKMAAPAGVATRFFSLQKTIDVIGKASPRQKIFIVAETPEDVLTLVKGRCAYKEGKHRQHAHVGRKAPSRHLRRS